MWRPPCTHALLAAASLIPNRSNTLVATHGPETSVRGCLSVLLQGLYDHEGRLSTCMHVLHLFSKALVVRAQYALYCIALVLQTKSALALHALKSAGSGKGTSKAMGVNAEDATSELQP